MTQAYSMDLRERVVAAVAAGETCRGVAERFSVGVSSVVRWSQRTRTSGSPAPRRRGGHRPLALAGQRDWLLARLAETPDLTLRALLPELAARGVIVTYFAVWHFFASQGISFKKSLHAAEQDRPDVARRRARWQAHQGKLDPARLVFLDETWAKTKRRPESRGRRTPSARPTPTQGPAAET